MGQVDRPRRRRPSEAAWTAGIEELMHLHEAEGWLPHAALEAVAGGLGVAARSLETRYGQALAAASRAAAWTISPDEIRLVVEAADFPQAYERLAAAGSVPRFVVVERALWADVSRALVGLRVAERRRRQRLAECAPPLGGGHAQLAPAA